MAWYIPRQGPRRLAARQKIAGVVKLVDARDSKSRDRKVMSVRARPPAPNYNPRTSGTILKALRNKGFFFFYSDYH
jgi:hypothetical protein